jgi:DNA-binding CsgD family transcriptional regulator
LSELANAREYLARIHDVVEEIAHAVDTPTITTLLGAGVQALGAERAVFYSAERGDTGLVACRLMLACGSTIDPAWSHHYLQSQGLSHDPWLAYASRLTEPVVASRLQVTDPEARRIVALAHVSGFASAALVPVHSGQGHTRLSLLCLGSGHAGYFEGPGFGRLKLGARNLAAELHAWWLARLREELVGTARFTPVDLELLRMECLGYSTTAMAGVLRISNESINSRFQRMARRLGVRRREDVVRLAVECGLLPI